MQYLPFSATANTLSQYN